MNINFESYPAEVRRENKYFLQALGSEHGHARYQWAWAGDLVMPMILMDEKGKIIYDYHCACGVNTTVHSADCNFTVPRAKWEIRNLAFGMKNAWVFVKWKAPESDKEVWESTFGSVPYPEGGYFIPVSTRTQCIHVFDLPYRQTSEAIVKAIREHNKKTAKQHTQDISDNWNKMDLERKENLRVRFKDAFPVHEGFPGKKENWSAGGLGESPALIKGEQQA